MLNESEARAATIVYLQSELAKSRRKLNNLASKSISESTPITQQAEAIQPAPPPYPCRRPSSSSSSVSSDKYESERPSSSRRLQIRRASSGHKTPVKVMGSVQIQPMPDPSVFFDAHDNYIQQEKALYEPRPPSVLPPIKKSNLVSTAVATANTQQPNIYPNDVLHGIQNPPLNDNVGLFLHTNQMNQKQNRFPSKQYVRVRKSPQGAAAPQEIAVSSMANRMSPERKVQEG